MWDSSEIRCSSLEDKASLVCRAERTLYQEGIGGKWGGVLLFVCHRRT